MLNRKGFSFIEVLVIVVLIAILSLIAVPSYKKGVETSKNNQARGKLLEIATAARMYNEDAHSQDRIAGYFGTPATGYQDPTVLFSSTVEGSASEGDDVSYAYLRDAGSFDPGTYTYRGYKFYICMPNGDGGGSGDSKCDSDINVIAIMEATSSVTDERYAGKKWKVSTSNPGKVVMMAASGT